MTANGKYKLRYAKGTYWRYEIGNANNLQVWREGQWVNTNHIALEGAEDSPWV